MVKWIHKETENPENGKSGKSWKPCNPSNGMVKWKSQAAVPKQKSRGTMQWAKPPGIMKK
jgi:hypothetical protein